MNAPSRITAYDWRTEPCAACDQDRRCEFCTGSGEVSAACVECNRIVPLDSEGTCLRCVDASILPIAAFEAKWHPMQSEAFKQMRDNLAASFKAMNEARVRRGLAPLNSPGAEPILDVRPVGDGDRTGIWL